MKRIVAILLLSTCLIGSAWAQHRHIAVLVATNPSVLQIDNVTQNVRFIHWANGLQLSGATLAEKAKTFFHDYGITFGIKDPSSAFLLEQNQIDKAGNTHLKFQQFHKGISFFGAQVQLHFDNRGLLKTLNGVVFNDPPITENPEISYSDAVSFANRFIVKTFPDDDLGRLRVQDGDLQFYHQGLAMHLPGNQRLAYALVLSNQKNIREHVFVDALNGQIIGHFPANCSLLHRRLFSQNSNNELWHEGEALPGALNNWQQTQLQATAETYQFFSNNFQFQSFNNLDAEMLLIDDVSFLDCPNASWNGVSVNFCQGVSSDDIVAHEWGHAYTEYTSQLLYAWQAGAINEAYSDIWGETIDLLNGDENQEGLRTDCDNNDRWKIAEGVLAIEGPIRDMWNPNCNADPGKISDIAFHCQTEDYGGVHTNSGIVNHAYALLVDGGKYNDINISGIGLTKAAHIFWHAQRYYLTRTSDFAALADALQAACRDLKATNLIELSFTPPSGNILQQEITSFDSIQLHHVLLAVEMRTPIDQCEDFIATLVTPAPALCPQEGEAFVPFFIETFEEGVDNWQINQLPISENTWNDRTWTLSDDLPDRRLGKAMYAPTPNTGDCDTNLENGLLRLQSPVISIPEDIDGDILLTFNHYFSFEKGQDGGNLKIQRNGNNWINIHPSAFLHNGYNQQLTNFSNPLLNQRVFTGANQGSVAGSWGTTQIRLSALGVRAGDQLIIRWEVGTDGCDGWDGWYVDDVLLATCSASAALPVDYLYFNAQQQNNKVKLTWETAAELNNKGFHVERSFDGHRFNTIGWVASNNEQVYQFTDSPSKNHQQIYYRLRQEDFDGKTDFSDIKVINQQASNAWHIYPNPASQKVNISFTNQHLLPITLSIRSLDGRLLKNPIVQEQNEVFSLPLDGLAPGIYLIQMQNKEGVFYKHLVVE